MLGALAEFSNQLAREMADHEQAIYRLAGREFNINSPRQLGEVFFEHLKLLDKPKKTPPASIPRRADACRFLRLTTKSFSVCSIIGLPQKLKSTYADTLPTTIWAKDRTRPHHLSANGHEHRSLEFAESQPAKHSHSERTWPRDP